MSVPMSEAAGTVAVLPVLGGGRALPPVPSVQIWIEVAWLLLAEGRAYIEDLEGGAAQPQMQQSAKLRLLETLTDVDQRLAGQVPVADQHCLALALEYGWSALAGASGTELAEIFGLTQDLGADECAVDGVLLLWDRLLAAFPGELPDRLVAEGQRDMLRTLRGWAGLTREVGLDVGLLTPFMKDA